MPDQEILDLDALEPTTMTVRLKGKTYELPAADGFPLRAAFEAARITAAPPEKQAELGIELLVTHFKLPREDLLDMTPKQFTALMKRLMPGQEAPASKDPPSVGPAPAKS